VYINEIQHHEVRWRNDELLSGYEHYTYVLDFAPSGFTSLKNFLEDIDIEALLKSTKSFDEYPGLEIYSRYEFEGMLIECFLKPDPDEPSLLMKKAVYTSTYLTAE